MAALNSYTSVNILLAYAQLVLFWISPLNIPVLPLSLTGHSLDRQTERQREGDRQACWSSPSQMDAWPFYHLMFATTPLGASSSHLTGEETETQRLALVTSAHPGSETGSPDLWSFSGSQCLLFFPTWGLVPRTPLGPQWCALRVPKAGDHYQVTLMCRPWTVQPQRQS